MDDLLLFTPTKKTHLAKYKDLLQKLLKNGLKLYSMKWQHFRKELQHMGSTIFITER